MIIIRIIIIKNDNNNNKSRKCRSYLQTGVDQGMNGSSVRMDGKPGTPPLSSSPHTLHPPLFIPTSYSSHSPPLILFPFTSNSFLQPNPLLSKIQTSTLFLIRNMAMYFLIIITEVLKGIIINRNTSSKSKDQLKLLEQSIISV